MSKLNYVEGDLFAAVETAAQPVVIPHIVNNKYTWGSGFVVPLGKKYPQAKKDYLAWQEYGPSPVFKLGETQFVVVKGDKYNPEIVIANMLAQTLGGSRPLYYNHLVSCMEQVTHFCLKHGRCQIVAPMFGSGLAGGNWLFIEELIKDCWLQENIPVTIHYLLNTIPANWTPPNETKSP